jgi:7,8-dihydropterin-6-yl-methyl-4-(beta-D-ribofuranosyl)aminobenzene 5'-phosphate synthase
MKEHKMLSEITLLVDNLAGKGLNHEHGLSIFIEHQGKRILFDNGQNEALFYNAEKLAISLSNLDVIILSHGHYDHGGNLKPLLLANPRALFFAHPDCLQTRYSLHPNKPARIISLSQQSIEAINTFPEQQKKWVTEPTEIINGLWVSGQIPRVCDVEDTGGPFFLDDEKKQKDFIYDDMSLWFDGKEGITVVCGCCHSGIMNTLTHIKNRMGPLAKINNLLGGLHLLNANSQRMNATLDYLQKQNINNFYPAHCTGENAMLLLSKQFNNKVEIARSGLKIQI